VNGGKWSQAKHTDIFGHQSSILHIVSTLVQALVVQHDEIFQALAREEIYLLPTPFLHLGSDGVVRWKSPASETFFPFSKHVKVQGGRVMAVRWVGWGPEMTSGAGRPLLPTGLGKSHRIL
jgi:hypothetical protein